MPADTTAYQNISVPYHNKDLKTGTLNNILKQAELK
ncbi:type II toxin-antitoxin system HicA family toxin [bacterium AH-315-G05]|nr:type II toxin-antitoxin system HicA family toxin [bacterium AH-315-L21]MBN4062860.1 type II toxin-antitoxin system HicA family toxin [Alkaliphilus sp. AH-315-G20]MBN4067849.1 type II toxin-antitoxin system HicA family toxin [Alkaliphilus transvaalensis]MBN4069686.1 type II toxin-antitoxin system HicA family toxin [bacterium AH-315-G05]